MKLLTKISHNSVLKHFYSNEQVDGQGNICRKVDIISNNQKFPLKTISITV